MIVTPHDRPADLFDAAGRRVEGMIVWADTDTGDVAVISVPVRFTIDHAGDETAAKEWKSYPAPLRIET